MFIVYVFISIMAVRHARDTVKNMCTTEQGFVGIYKYISHPVNNIIMRTVTVELMPFLTIF